MYLIWLGMTCIPLQGVKFSSFSECFSHSPVLQFCLCWHAAWHRAGELFFSQNSNYACCGSYSWDAYCFIVEPEVLARAAGSCAGHAPCWTSSLCLGHRHWHWPSLHDGHPVWGWSGHSLWGEEYSSSSVQSPGCVTLHAWSSFLLPAPFISSVVQLVWSSCLLLRDACCRDARAEYDTKGKTPEWHQLLLNSFSVLYFAFHFAHWESQSF